MAAICSTIPGSMETGIDFKDPLIRSVFFKYNVNDYEQFQKNKCTSDINHLKIQVKKIYKIVTHLSMNSTGTVNILDLSF